MTLLLTQPTVATQPDPADGPPVTVLVADDHPLFRRGVARAIARRPGLELVAEARDGREALDLIVDLEPDVAILDHRMPGLTAVEICEALGRRLERPATAVLVLSAFEDADIVATAVGAGAAGYVGKTASQAEILEAVDRVASGGVAFAGWC